MLYCKFPDLISSGEKIIENWAYLSSLLLRCWASSSQQNPEPCHLPERSSLASSYCRWGNKCRACLHRFLKVSLWKGECNSYSWMEGQSSPVQCLKCHFDLSSFYAARWDEENYCASPLGNVCSAEHSAVQRCCWARQGQQHHGTVLLR